MTLPAGFPTWLIVVFVVMFVSQARFFARYRGPRSLSKSDRKDGLDARQIEEALGQRDQVIEDLQRRLSEMESRLDFTERLLSEKSHAAGEQ